MNASIVPWNETFEDDALVSPLGGLWIGLAVASPFKITLNAAASVALGRNIWIYYPASRAEHLR